MMNTKKTLYSLNGGRKSSGFILVEVIAAVSILMLAVPAALTIASRSVFLASYAKDQVIGTYLAQEGIEIIRNKRDQNMLRIAQSSPILWDDGFGAGICTDGGLRCIVDFGWNGSDPVIQTCSGVCPVLDKETSGAYAHIHSSGTWQSTSFRRVITISSIVGNPNELRVTSTVTYNNHGIDKTIAVTSSLTPWLQ